MGHLFGTDGIRGVANRPPMTAEVALRLGRAVANKFSRADRRGRVVIGKDTRLSGYMLENALAAGVMSLGADVIVIGPLPTPGVAALVTVVGDERHVDGEALPVQLDEDVGDRPVPPPAHPPQLRPVGGVAHEGLVEPQPIRRDRVGLDQVAADEPGDVAGHPLGAEVAAVSADLETWSRLVFESIEREAGRPVPS